MVGKSQNEPEQNHKYSRKELDHSWRQSKITVRPVQRYSQNHLVYSHNYSQDMAPNCRNSAT